jgi:hypothetical protein
MRDRDYFPAGAYNDPNAPYNEVTVPDHDFDVEVQVTLANSTTVTTNDYMPDVDEEDGRMYTDTSSTDWEKAYNESCYSIPQMLEELKVLLEEKIADPNCNKKTKYKQMLEDCQGWELIESEVSEM